jgi:hypothetical protein
MICASVDPICIGYTGLQPSRSATDLYLLKVEDWYMIKHLSKFLNQTFRLSWEGGGKGHTRETTMTEQKEVFQPQVVRLFTVTHTTQTSIILGIYNIYTINIHDKDTQLTHTPSCQSSRFRHIVFTLSRSRPPPPIAIRSTPLVVRALEQQIASNASRSNLDNQRTNETCFGRFTSVSWCPHDIAVTLRSVDGRNQKQLYTETPRTKNKTRTAKRWNTAGEI